jgi:predicted ATPase/class 3 adenylate cyclase
MQRRREVPTTWPSGFVTFVLTDIEGSTRLLRRLGRRYEALIDRHNTLLRDSWERHGGAHVSDRGDSCLAAFGNAADALEACADAQRRLSAARWPADGVPRVRMGLHAGVASPRSGDYVALAVHQAARVADAAHGGQVLASEVVATESGALSNLTLEPVGRYRLRDFDDPVRLHCLRGPGLESSFAAVRAMPVDGHNLAVPSTSLVGRDGDVSAVVPELGAGRLVTLTGTGGVGKTRLALATGLSAAEQWEDGVWFVDLSPLQDARLIGRTVADAVGASVTGAVDSWDATLEHLRRKRALLIVDNCEHLAHDVAGLLRQLMAACRQVGVLATSREALAIAGEQVFRVDPLPLAPLAASVASATSVPSVRLFVERAKAANPGFDLDHSNVATVVELCRRLDGLPLALELAAAQLSVLGIDDLLAQLGERSAVLRSRQRGVPERQTSLEAIVSWSMRLLEHDEEALLRRLSVLRGGFTLDVAAVCGADIAGCDVPSAVWALVDKSLVVLDVAANGTRYRLLETVRAELRTLLDEERATVATAIRLSDWWLDRLGPWLHTDRSRSGEIEVELDNLRAMIPLLANPAEERAQQIVCSIGRHFYKAHGSPDAIDELSRYADVLTTPSPARVSMLGTLAMMQVHRGDIAAARQVLAAAERELVVSGAPRWDEVAVERATGEVALRSGDPDAAAELARHALERDITPAARARMLNMLAIASYFSGDVARAAAAFGDELDAARLTGDEHLIIIAEGNVAELALRMGDIASAARHQAACLELALALGRPVSVAMSFIVAARLIADTDPIRAGRLHANAEAILDENNFKLYDEDLQASQTMLADVRRRLGSEEFDRARERGRTMALHDAVILAEETLARLST